MSENVAEANPQQTAKVKREKRKRRTKHRSPLARATISVLRILCVSYAAILLTLVWMEDRLIYPAAFDDAVATQPASYKTVETVSYTSTDKLTLQGRLIEKPDSKRTILFFHGDGNKAIWLDDWIARLSQTLDATVMAAEYRGYQDDATPSEKGILEDCFAARDYLCKRYDTTPDQIILYGRSLGGGCAVALASRGGAKALILDATFDRMYEVAAEKYPFVPVRWLMRNRYDSVAKLTAYHGPLIQIHGGADVLIPIERAKCLFDGARCEPKRFVELPSLQHSQALPQATLYELNQWLDDLEQS